MSDKAQPAQKPAGTLPITVPIMLCLSLIVPASGSSGAAGASRLEGAEELQQAWRLLELRRELLASALLDPAILGELEQVAAELDAGQLRLEAAVDEPGSAVDARARFEQLLVQVRALHAASATRSSSFASAPDATGSGAVPSREVAGLGAELQACRVIAGSVRLEWTLVDRLLESSWVRRARAGHRTAASSALPGALARHVAATRAEVSSIVERFVRSQQGLVYGVAQRYRGLGLSREDLMQDGNIGLLRAIEKFDPQRGTPFAGYAVWWVRQAMRDAIAARARTIRLPVSALTRRSTLSRASHELAERLGREPSEQELSVATGVPAESVAAVLRMPKEPLSLDAPRFAEDGRTLGDVLHDPFALAPHEATSARELSEELESLAEVLTPRERWILGLRFGLDGGDEHTLQQIGDVLGLTRERVRQIVNAALEKLSRATQGREL